MMGGGGWLGRIAAGMDVVDLREAFAEAELVEHPHRIGRIAICEDELASGQAGDRLDQQRVTIKHAEIDIVHEIEKLTRLDVVMRHQPEQGGDVAVEIVILGSDERRGGKEGVSTWRILG